MADLRLHVVGPEAEAGAAADVLAELVEREFGRAPERRVEAGARREGERDLATGLAVLGVVLALPGAIKEGLDVAERLGLLERIRRLIGVAREEKRERGVVVRIETRDGLREIAVMGEGEVLDALVVVRGKD